MNELLALPADLVTALTVIVTGAVIPAVTALLNRPTLPVWVRRGIPIVLAILAAAVIVLLRAGGPFAEQAVTWLLVASTLVGLAQGLYALMPSVWKRIEATTTPTTAVSPLVDMDAARTDAAHGRRAATGVRATHAPVD